MGDAAQTSGIAHTQRMKGSSSKSTAAQRERRQQKSMSEIRRKGAFFEGELASQGPTQLQERFTVRAEEQTTRNTIHEKQNKQNTGIVSVVSLKSRESLLQSVGGQYY